LKSILIASTSTLFEDSYLNYLKQPLHNHFNGIKQLLFIPYARPGGITHKGYTAKVKTFFKTLDIDVVGIHEFKSPVNAVEQAEGIFVGGGNTFVLVKMLYHHQLIDPIKKAVHGGVPYLGTSAGSNICGLTMQTTNDMPIVYPPSFKTFGFVPFNINPHYLDPIPNVKHMGETRATRIKEFHAFNTPPVLGLREGSWLDVKGDTVKLKGKHRAIIFKYNSHPEEIDPNTDLSHLN